MFIVADSISRRLIMRPSRTTLEVGRETEKADVHCFALLKGSGARARAPGRDRGENGASKT